MNKFDSRLKLIPNDVWVKISSIEGLRGHWAGSTKLSPQILSRLKKSVLFT